MYLIILTFDRSVNATDHMTICHFTIALINPVPNISEWELAGKADGSVRVILVSLNVFGLLCDGLGARTSKPYGDILQFGGPILYLIMQSLVCFAILVWVDSGAPLPALFRRHLKGGSSEGTPQDVIEERERVEHNPNDALVVRSLSKKFHGTQKLAVDSVSFGVDSGDTFALLGPNGAGKTTALACIRGVVSPVANCRGRAHLAPSCSRLKAMSWSLSTQSQNSATRRKQKCRGRADLPRRAALGVCPQVNAIDSLLTGMFLHRPIQPDARRGD